MDLKIGKRIFWVSEDYYGWVKYATASGEIINFDENTIAVFGQLPDHTEGSDCDDDFVRPNQGVSFLNINQKIFETKEEMLKEYKKRLQKP